MLDTLTVSPFILTGINANLTAASTICKGGGLPATPPATDGDIIRSSVAIADYVIPKVVNDLTYAITSLSDVKTMAIVTITRIPLTIASLDFFTDVIAEVMG